MDPCTVIKNLSEACIELSADEWTIVKIRNQREAIEYGRPSWCTGKKDSFWFDRSYSTDRGELFVFYKNVRKRPQYQLFLSVHGGVELRDAQNRYVDRAKLAKLNTLIEMWLERKGVDISTATNPFLSSNYTMANMREWTPSANYVEGDIVHNMENGALMVRRGNSWVPVD